MVKSVNIIILLKSSSEELIFIDNYVSVEIYIGILKLEKKIRTLRIINLVLKPRTFW